MLLLSSAMQATPNGLVSYFLGSLGLAASGRCRSDQIGTQRRKTYETLWGERCVGETIGLVWCCVVRPRGCEMSWHAGAKIRKLLPDELGIWYAAASNQKAETLGVWLHASKRQEICRDGS